jgi:hypothetical protein
MRHPRAGEATFGSLTRLQKVVPGTNWMRGLCTYEVTDGNFKADHLTPKNEADDVHLTNGEAFMTADGPYQAFMLEATEKADQYKKVEVLISSLTVRVLVKLVAFDHGWSSIGTVS